MKILSLAMVVAMACVLIGCGGAHQEQPAAAEGAQTEQATPVFNDNFESGEAQHWTEDEAKEKEAGEAAAQTPTQGDDSSTKDDSSNKDE